MLVEHVRQLSPFQRLLHWIEEREMIRLHKEAGKPRPWTDNAVLQRYRFCNVRRMDDRVSQWLLKKWYEPNYGHKNMVIACCLARFFNKTSTLKAIGFPNHWNPKVVLGKVQKLKAAGHKVFNGAYIITGSGGHEIDKISTVINYFMPLVVGLVLPTGTMEEAWQVLKGCRGLGPFMAGQVVADLRWATPGQWADRLTWAPMGPGSKRGMNRLLGQPLNTPMNQARFLQQLTATMARCRDCLPLVITRRLEAMDFQNCLCEFDKMERTLFDGRHPKQYYKPFEERS